MASILYCVRCEVLSEVTKKKTVFQQATLCSSVETQ